MKYLGSISDSKDLVNKGYVDDSIEAGLEAVFKWLGVTTTSITDGSSTNPITINNESVTAVEGSVVGYNNSEFLFDGSNWKELGKDEPIAFESFSGPSSVSTTTTFTYGSYTYYKGYKGSVISAFPHYTGSSFRLEMESSIPTVPPTINTYDGYYVSYSSGGTTYPVICAGTGDESSITSYPLYLIVITTESGSKYYTIYSRSSNNTIPAWTLYEENKNKEIIIEQELKEDSTNLITNGAVAKSVGELKNALNDLETDLAIATDFNIITVANTFINKNTGAPGTSTGYIATDYIPVVGAVWLYTYTGDDNSGYAFYDGNKAPISYGATYPIRRIWTKLDVPEGAIYFRATCGVNQANEFGIKLQIADEVTYALNRLPELDSISADLTKDSYTFKNNLSTDGVDKLPTVAIIKNGITSKNNYGLSGSCYSFTMPYKKMHLYCEFRQDEAIANALGSVASKRIVSAFATGYFILTYNGSLYQNGELFQSVTAQVISGSNSQSLQLNSIAYKRFQGEDAFSIEYTNAVDSNSICTLSFTDSAVVVNVDGTETTISVDSTTTVSSLVALLNTINGISAKVIIAEDKKYTDLLPVVAKNTATATNIDLIYSGTLYDSTAYTEALKVYIPLAINNDWHSVEMIYEPSANGIVAVAIDGITVSVAYGNTTPNTSLILNYNQAPYTIRNLVIDYDGFGDAEVVDNLIDPSITNYSKQLISSHNPRLLIYEGHGVDVCADADAPVSDNMACSTERLRILFDTALSKGYVSVTWGDIINWKLNGAPLPKRCFAMMFDDWRLENYIDYDKRKPFVDYNVKAGLAVITNNVALTDAVTINGLSYTAEQCVDIVKTAGWYPTSHTHGHRRITSYTPSANEALLKEDVLEADRYGIHSDILVYPYGEIAQQYMPVVAHSGFALGVNVVKNWYNCKGTNNYNLCRVELGTRVPLSTVLYPLV